MYTVWCTYQKLMIQRGESYLTSRKIYLWVLPKPKNPWRNSAPKFWASSTYSHTHHKDTRKLLNDEVVLSLAHCYILVISENSQESSNLVLLVFNANSGWEIYSMLWNMYLAVELKQVFQLL